jgi:hypothetical protein
MSAIEKRSIAKTMNAAHNSRIGLASIFGP